MMVGRAVALDIDRPEVHRGGKNGSRWSTLTCISAEGVTHARTRCRFRPTAARSWALPVSPAAGRKSCAKPLRGCARCRAAPFCTPGQVGGVEVHENLVGKSPMDIIKKGRGAGFCAGRPPGDGAGSRHGRGRQHAAEKATAAAGGPLSTAGRRVRWRSRSSSGSRSSRPG